MSEPARLLTDEQLVTVASGLARHRSLYGQLLDLDQFTSLLKKLDARVAMSLGRASVELLWRLGLLRADLVLAPHDTPLPPELQGLILMQREYDQAAYADARMIVPMENGLLGAKTSLPTLPEAIRPLFHPFRIFVAYALDELLALNICRIQPLLGDARAGLGRLVDSFAGDFANYTRSEEFALRWARNGELASLAIGCEPCSRGKVGGVSYKHSPATWADFEKDRDAQETAMQGIVTELGPRTVALVHRELMSASEKLDSNRNVLTFLRLSRPETWRNVTGRLGGALRVRLMAEHVRRVFEMTSDDLLPEEDDGLYGRRMEKVKRRLYGAERMLEGDPRVVGDFLRHNFAEFRLAARFYVEGSTEVGAAEAYLGNVIPLGIELVDLKGRVREKTVCAFEESLAADRAHGRYSFIALDGDRSDFVDVVRRAAREERFHGEFVVSTPDFELANFSREELADAAWDVLREQNPDAPTEWRDELDALATESRSGEDFKRSVRHNWRPRGLKFGKGLEWGRALVSVAYRERSERDRPFFELCERVGRARSTLFLRSCEAFSVNPRSGRLERREDTRG